MHYFCMLFQVHKIARGEILDQILNRIMIKATSPVIHLIGLFISIFPPV